MLPRVVASRWAFFSHAPGTDVDQFCREFAEGSARGSGSNALVLCRGVVSCALAAVEEVTIPDCHALGIPLKTVENR